MKRGRPLPALTLNMEEHNRLVEWTRRRKSAQALALRARIVLACSHGDSNSDIAQRMHVTKQTVSKWRNRFLAHRLDGLLDAPRPGQPRKISDAQVEEVIARTVASRLDDATHWSTRQMARASGLNQTAVSRIWLNLVERWFALLSERQIKRGSHRSTVELERAFRHYLDLYNDHPTPFVWHKTADQIIASVGRFCTRINDSGH